MTQTLDLTRDERESVLDEAYPVTWPMEYGSVEEAMALAEAELDAEEAQRGWNLREPHKPSHAGVVLLVVTGCIAAALGIMALGARWPSGWPL
jgi:hypothetical protein